ncbi:hypothetical protein CC86DRAFT_403763 [Ophiobolus disseminans]|uniref:Uncharacterized protein n=1 Tax=Ophiobolus disseminans TaxID=1469910 RepID=A0A6A7A7E6_9PLEO|nr:hypothetical protein CC86DRAFT_403763 [Ophiobolus disseminans]
MGVLGLFAVVGIRFAFVGYRWVNRTLPFAARPGANWNGLVWTVNLSTIALMIRTFLRLLEPFDAEHNGYVTDREQPMWVFDVVPILGIVILFALISPALHLPPTFLGFYLSKKTICAQLKDPPLSHETGSRDFESAINCQSRCGSVSTR